MEAARVFDSKPNSAEARDIAFHLHSQTNPQRHAEIGPLIMARGEGVHVSEADAHVFELGLGARARFGRAPGRVGRRTPRAG